MRLAVVLSLLAGSPSEPSWHGPSPRIWQTSKSSNASCTLTGSVRAASVAECERACEAAAVESAGAGSCNAVNFDTDPTATGARCMLVDCPARQQPGWSVPEWVGYAMFAVPTPPPTPPTPPPLPRLPLMVLAARAAAAGAACLDGSPPGFYWQKGSGSGADKWVVFLNGGGCEHLSRHSGAMNAASGWGGEGAVPCARTHLSPLHVCDLFQLSLSLFLDPGRANRVLPRGAGPT